MLQLGNRKGEVRKEEAQKKKRRRKTDKPPALGAPGTAADDPEDDDSRGLHLGVPGPERQPKLRPRGLGKKKSRKGKKSTHQQRRKKGRDKSKGATETSRTVRTGGGVKQYAELSAGQRDVQAMRATEVPSN